VIVIGGLYTERNSCDISWFSYGSMAVAGCEKGVIRFTGELKCTTEKILGKTLIYYA